MNNWHGIQMILTFLVCIVGIGLFPEEAAVFMVVIMIALLIRIPLTKK